MQTHSGLRYRVKDVSSLPVLTVEEVVMHSTSTLATALAQSRGWSFDQEKSLTQFRLCTSYQMVDTIMVDTMEEEEEDYIPLTSMSMEERGLLVFLVNEAV